MLVPRILVFCGRSLLTHCTTVCAMSDVIPREASIFQHMDICPVFDEASSKYQSHISVDPMDSTPIQNPWVHYHHNDNLDPKRWSTEECYRYLEDRPWAEVSRFYALVAGGEFSLSDIIFSGQPKFTGSQGSTFVKNWRSSMPSVAKNESEKRRGGKWERKTYKLVISYDGSAFIGWQKQPGSITVQGLLEQTLGRFVDGKRASSLEGEGIPVEAALSVAGRTDKGVHAVGQVCSFYTWRTDIKVEDIESLINELAPKALRVVHVEEVSRTFHPNFSAKWRRYVYILPLHNLETKERPLQGHNHLAESCAPVQLPVENVTEIGKKHSTFDVMAVNELLSQLEGKSLSCTVFARDTKASRSRGSPTVCDIYHARAAIAELPAMENVLEGERTKVMCVEIVANRFLRKMVRVLVATSVREAAAGAPCDSLLRLAGVTCRQASAPPAPACGLCLAEVGYDDVSPSNLLIK